MKHFAHDRIQWLAGIVLSVAMGAWSVTPVLAQNSTFSVEITPLDCAHTTYTTAVGEVNDADCAWFDPAISIVEPRDGRPIIRGVFDAIHTKIDPETGVASLWITVNGQTYVLGVDSELTVDGNAWVLDLSHAAEVLFAPGEYPISMTVVPENGDPITAYGQLVIPRKPLPEGVGAAVQIVIDRLASTGMSTYVIGITGLVCLLLASMMLVGKRRIDRRAK